MGEVPPGGPRTGRVQRRQLAPEVAGLWLRVLLRDDVVPPPLRRGEVCAPLRLLRLWAFVRRGLADGCDAPRGQGLGVATGVRRLLP